MDAKGERLRRWVLLPLLLAYFVVMILAAWPRLLTPGKRATRAQLFALNTLYSMGIYAGQEVFGGQGVIEAYPRRRCVQILVMNDQGEQYFAFDNFADCDQDVYRFSKPALDLFHDRMLIKAVDHAHLPNPGQLGAYPLSYILAITDYYCHGTGLGPMYAIAVRHRVQETGVIDAELTDKTYFGGARYCDAPGFSLEPLPGFEDFARGR